MTKKWITVAKTDEIPVGDRKLLELNDSTPIAIFNLEGEYYTIEDRCPHQQLPLADGLMDNDEIICPFHGAQFNIKTGALTAPPACDNLVTFPTKVLGNDIQIEY